MDETFIATEPGQCSTCAYDYSAGEEIGNIFGELNCAGCYERAVDAA